LGKGLVESDLIASDSITAVMEGHHYNGVMSAHKIVMEAMKYLRLKVFQEWISTTERHEDQAVKKAINKICTDFIAEKITALLLSPDCKHFLELFDRFCNTNQGLLAAFWVHTSYMRGELETPHFFNP